MPRKKKVNEDTKSDLEELKGIGEDTAEQLKSYGVYTIAELAQTPGILLRVGGVKIKDVETILANAREHMRVNKPILLTEMKPKWKLSTGVEALDNLLHGGVESQGITEFYGEYSSGKSQCCLTLAAKAVEAGGVVIYIDTEHQIKPERLKQIIIARGLPEESLARIYIAPTINSDHQINLVRYEVAAIARENPVKLLVVDYLQLADPGRRYDNRVQEVSIVSQALKNLARELKIPVLAVSQLSRAVEHRGERKPQLADLRESGAIEQDADVVMFLYRTDAEAVGSVIPTKLSIAKHRNGPMGEVDLLFKGDRIRFYSVDKKREGGE